ncbi:MAG: ABC transporter substrate-binding protein [Chloroflexi bacterium]|nr:ABC transporter substrate-binding protein [Chloroflexota bacterium]
MRIPAHIRVISLVLLALMLVLAACAKTTPTPTTTAAPTATAAPSPTATAAPSPTVRPTTAAPTTAAPAPTTTAAPRPTAAVPQGTLRLAINTFGGEGGFDPILRLGGSVSSIATEMFGTMIDLDNKANLVPSLLEKFEVAPDGLSWILTLRKGLKFSNGDDVTSADVKFSLERYASKDSHFTDIRDNVTKVDIVDNNTVRVYTKAVMPYFILMLTHYAPSYTSIMPKKYIEQNGAAYFDQNPMGAGPWKLVRYAPGDMIEYEANMGFWKGPPAFKTFQMMQVPEETVRVAMLRTGDAEIADISNDNLAPLEASGFKTLQESFHAPMLHIHGIFYPEAKGMPLADVRVRKALSLSIPRDEINKTFFLGKSGPPLPSRIAMYVPEIDTARWQKWAAENLRYDPAAATQLLKDAGYPNGFSMKLYTYSHAPGTYLPKLAEILQGYWKRLGINAQVITVERGAFRKISEPVQKELIGQASTARSNANPINTQPLKAGFGASGTYNLFNVAPRTTNFPEFEALINKIDTEPDVKKRGALLDQAIQFTADQWLNLQLGSVFSYWAHSARVELPAEVRPSTIEGAGYAAHLFRPVK